MKVRPATAADAETGCRVLRRSIAELCHADHGGDPASIAAWTANKTPENWLGWLSLPGASLLVAENDGDVVGVGLVDAAGTILLNYVAPQARNERVSTALLAAMEKISAQRGIAACRLTSTKTALRFYLRRGYAPETQDDDAALVKNLA